MKPIRPAKHWLTSTTRRDAVASERKQFRLCQQLRLHRHGAMSTETYGNGAVHSIVFNRALQASEIKLKQSASGAELQRYNYLYGTVTQATGAVDTTKNVGQVGQVSGYINGVKQWDQRFSYDAMSRLQKAAEYRGDNGQQTGKRSTPTIALGTAFNQERVIRASVTHPYLQARSMRRAIALHDRLDRCFL